MLDTLPALSLEAVRDFVAFQWGDRAAGRFCARLLPRVAAGPQIEWANSGGPDLGGDGGLEEVGTYARRPDRLQPRATED